MKMLWCKCKDGKKKIIDFKLIHVWYCTWIAIQAHFYRDQTRFLVNSVYLDVAKRLIEMLCKSCEELLNIKESGIPSFDSRLIIKRSKRSLWMLAWQNQWSSYIGLPKGPGFHINWRTSKSDKIFVQLKNLDLDC